LELDVMPSPAARGRHSGTLARVSAPKVPSSGGSVAPPVALVPGGRGEASPHAEAVSLADYGESPTSLWQAPLYAYRVKTRQAELRRQLAERRVDLARARQAEEDAKLAFAERARPIAEKAGAFQRGLEAIATHERLMVQRDGALSVEMDAHERRLSVIDERVLGLESELVTAKADEHELEEKLAGAEAVRQRAEAKLRRAEIEVRNAGSLADMARAAQRAQAKRAGPPE
jgi:hypothetical protein